jgi:hypothetical protein
LEESVQTYQVLKAEKDHVAETLAYQLEARFPGFKERIEVGDIAMPITFE